MQRENDACLVCNTMAKYLDPVTNNYLNVECPRCGKFFIKSPFVDEEKTYVKIGETGTGVAVSAWIREQNILGERPTVVRSIVEQATMTPLPNLIERSRRLLRECGRRTRFYDQNVFDPILALVAITRSADEAEIQSLADLLREEGLLRKGAAPEFRLTARGIAEVETERRKVDSDQAFVAMAFDAEFRSAYDNGFDPGIRAAGYRPLRVDRHEHVNRIDDEIIAQILHSNFVVADFTAQKHGVYFEAGFALGLSKSPFGKSRMGVSA